jgi:DNA mismatch repair protein MutS2
LDIQGKKAVIAVGEIRMTVNLKQLQKIRPPQRKQGDTSGRMPVLSMNQARLELNVIGKRVEEALPEVDKFLDEARLSGLREVRILHGKGSGILRDAIRKHLRDLGFVRHMQDAPVEQGGAGWTLVELDA